MNKKILIILGLVWSISSFSQKILNGYSAPQTVVDGSTIRMLPGFHANSNDGSYSGANNKFIAKISSTEPTVPPDPNIGNTSTSSGENYVYSRNYLVPVTESNAYAPQVQSITYLDGLGRTKQNISIKSTPAGNDVVTKIEYDEFGRQLFDFLPMPQGGTTNSGIYGSVSQSVGAPLYGSGPYFAKKDIENSPLERLNSTTAPGEWNTNNKKVILEYLANTNNEVLKFNTSTTWSTDAKSITESALSLASGNYYTANTLYKNKVTDEDGNITYEYKNGQGQIILVRKMLNATDAADTYYVYNEYDQLAYVLSPLASEAIKNNPSIDLSSGGTTLSQLCYQYQYDSRNRLTEKKLPGKGKEYMVYDKADRLVLSQDTNMKLDNKWMLTKYDKFGRVVYTGILPGSDRSTMQTQAGNFVITEERDGTGFAKNGLQIYYSNDYFSGVETLLSVNYYDTYPAYADAPTFGDYDQYGQKFLKQTYASSELNPNTQLSTKGLPTASLVKTIDANTWTKTFTFYDQKGRAIYTQSNNHLGGYTLTASSLDFSGTVKQSYTRHKRDSGSAPAEVKINERFVYDHQNRLKQHYHQVDSGAEVLLTDNTYDELGRLKSKKVGNDLQTMDFDYNIRGWMKSINNIDNLGSDLFAYKINYNTREGLQTPNLDYTGLTVEPRYNGNIAEISWKSLEYVGMTVQNTPQRQGFVYDRFNRLLAGFYQNPDSPASKDNSEIIDYDLNGNIQHLKRTGAKLKGNVKVIDNLTYTYQGNQVTNIGDASNIIDGYEGGSGLIEYDQNGNMTKMPDKGITQIDYNYLNLPFHITQQNPTTYQYRADGVKLDKTFTVNNTDGSATVHTQYLDGFQYTNSVTLAGRAILNSDDPEVLNSTRASEIETFQPVNNTEDLAGGGGPIDINAMNLQFFPTAEGFYDYEKKQYIYQYKDHLGNARLSFGRNTETQELEVLDFNNYYPFGMNFSSSHSVFDATGTPFNYKYNGKELQETGMYDYGARMYMPDIGRWGVVDPLAETSRRWSTYNYAYNNPIRFIDPDGRQGTDWFKDKQGNYVYDANLNSLNANTKLTNGEEYLGQSANVTLVNSETKSSVGEIHLEADGNATVSGEWAEAGNVSYEHIAKESGFGLVVDAKLADGAKVYGVDTFAQDSYNQYNFPEIGQFSFNAKEFAQDSFKTPEAEPTTVGSVVDKIGKDISGTGMDNSYCSQCPGPTAGPGPIQAAENKSAYDAYRMGVALNHLLWHNKKKDNESKK